MAATAHQPAVDLREPPSWRRTKNRIMTVLMVLALLIIMVPLVFVLVTVISKGIGIISTQFLTASIPPDVLPGNIGGMGPAVVGTLEITALATVMAVPLGVLGAIYLNEYGRGGKTLLARVIGFMADVMTGVPSIVMGLFIFSIWTLHFGFSGLGGAFALACLMLPLVIRSSQEMLSLVPDALREGSYALGATRARVTMTAAVHHPDRDHHEQKRVQRPDHGLARADLRQRDVSVQRRPGPGLGRRADLDRDRFHTLGRGPDHHRTIHPSGALGSHGTSA
jgi:phosphate transport system permease protein